jgi:predicted nucleic acid-binding protein
MIQGGTSLDTSVVIRLLVGQPADQYRRAMEFLRGQLSAGRAVHVSDLVLAEAYFALQGFYQLPKPDALQALALFARHSGVTVTPVGARGLVRIGKLDYEARTNGSSLPANAPTPTRSSGRSGC